MGLSGIDRPMFGRKTLELPIWLAMLAMGAVGAVFGYLFFSRRRDGLPLLGAGSPASVQINNYSNGYGPAGLPSVALPPGLQGGAMPGPGTKFETFTLAPDQGYILFMATGGHRWRVKVRVVSPPGSFAMFAPDQVSLNNTGVVGARAIIVPAGQETEMFLLNGDRLYGRGNVAGGVIVSMTASVEATEAFGG